MWSALKNTRDMSYLNETIDISGNRKKTNGRPHWLLQIISKSLEDSVVFNRLKSFRFIWNRTVECSSVDYVQELIIFVICFRL